MCYINVIKQNLVSLLFGGFATFRRGVGSLLSWARYFPRRWGGGGGGRVVTIGTLRYVVGHPATGDVLRIGSAIM